jgi:hypothetical protein
MREVQVAPARDRLSRRAQTVHHRLTEIRLRASYPVGQLPAGEVPCAAAGSRQRSLANAPKELGDSFGRAGAPGQCRQLAQQRVHAADLIQIALTGGTAAVGDQLAQVLQLRRAIELARGLARQLERFIE